MLATMICVVLAIICLTQGAVEGAIALGILAAIIHFFFGSKTSSSGNKGPQSTPQPKQEKKAQPALEHRATPSMVAHYSSSPVVAQIVRDIRKTGNVVSLSISQGGYDLTATGAGFYQYIFKDHGYQPLTIQEQEAFLQAIVEQLPHSETYAISFEHRENSVIPLRYLAGTSFYRTNQYRWNPDSGEWEKMVKL